jgi:hypothetical protein
MQLREKLLVLFGLTCIGGFIWSGPSGTLRTPVLHRPMLHASGSGTPVVVIRGAESIFEALVSARPLSSESDSLISLLVSPLPGALRNTDVTLVVEALVDLAEMAPSAERDTRLATLFGFCCATDPAGAANLAQNFVDRGLRDESATFVLRLWAESDPKAALAWAEAHPRDETDRANFYAAFEGYAGTTPLDALAFIYWAHPEGDLEKLVAIVVGQISAHDKLEEASVCVAEMPAGPMRQLLTSRLLHE